MNWIAQLKQSEFLRHNAVFFVGSVFVGILNYLYYPILGRLMDPAEFGEVQTLVSLFLQFTILLNVLSMITVTIVTNYPDKKAAHTMIFELEKITAYLAFALLAISLIGGDFLQQQLQFSSSLPFVALALALIISVPLTFRSAYARSQKRFGITSASQLIGASIKIVFSAGLVVVGLGTLGAIAGIVIAQLIAFLYAARWAGRLGFARPAGNHYGTLPDLRAALPELKYAGLVFAGLLSITLLMSIDIIVVKYFFDAETAGLYAGVATVARILFFLAAPIAQVLIPMITLRQTALQNRRLIGKSLALTAGVCLPVLGLCVIAPEFVVTLLMGDTYDRFASLLPVLATTVFMISVMNLLCMYFLALRKKAVVAISAAGFGISFLMMLVWHNEVRSIVFSMLAGATFMLIATGIYVATTAKKGV
jgi:O-antigen/teichoic acid export membrane protein